MNQDFKPSRFDSVARHFNHETVFAGLVHGPFLLGLLENCGCERRKTRATDE